MYSVEWGVGIVECKVLSVECKAWSGLCGVGIVQCKVLSVWSVKCKV